MSFGYNFQMRIRAPRPVVFERLLRIEHLSRWFCGWSRIEPKVGGSFKFGGETCIFLPEQKSWETTIDEGDVLRRFAFTWPIRGSNTRVIYELEDSEAGSTALHARHTGVPFPEVTCGSVQDAWRMCLGNLKSISEGRGDSVRPDHSPVTDPELRLSALIEKDVPNVFDAFSDPTQLDHWSTGGVGRGIARVEPRPRGAFSFGWQDGPDHILEWERNRRIALRWARPSRDLAITFDFEEKASGTAVYFSATGFLGDDRKEVVHQRGRWSDLLVCLKNFVEGGASGFVNRYEDQVRET